MPGINALPMAVAPVDCNGIGADLIDVLHVQLRILGCVQKVFVRGLAHIGVAALAFGAGADGAQAGEGVAALFAVHASE